MKIAALRTNVAYMKPPDMFVGNSVFIWNIATDEFNLIEPPDGTSKLLPFAGDVQPANVKIPAHTQRKVLVMDFNPHLTKQSLRDYSNCYEILLDDDPKVYGKFASSPGVS